MERMINSRRIYTRIAIVIISTMVSSQCVADNIWEVQDREKFDNYVFYMDWTPEYCHANIEDKEIFNKCKEIQNRTDMFLIPEGLFVTRLSWKQLSLVRGHMMTRCYHSKFSLQNLREDVKEKIDSMYTITPNMPQIVWEKYGTCTQKNINDFFNTIWIMYRKFKIAGKELTKHAGEIVSVDELEEFFVPYVKHVGFECSIKTINEETFQHLSKIFFTFDKQYTIVPGIKDKTCDPGQWVIIRDMQDYDQYEKIEQAI